VVTIDNLENLAAPTPFLDNKNSRKFGTPQHGMRISTSTSEITLIPAVIVVIPQLVN
jgi:hypothetical protein